MPRFSTPVQRKITVRDSTRLEELQDQLRKMVERGPEEWLPEDRATPTLDERQEREEAWIRWHEELVALCKRVEWEDGLDQIGSSSIRR